MNSIGVLLVDDHALFVEALGARLAAETDIDVLAVAHDELTAMSAMATLRPDVVVLDVALGRVSGNDLLSQMLDRHPDQRVVMLTALDEVDDVVEAVRRGAKGWLHKAVAGDELVRVIRGVARGESWIPPGLLGGVLERLTATPTAGGDAVALATLTGREREVLQRLVDGLSRAEIAKVLRLSPNTVRTHTQNLLGKLGVHSGLEAAAVALRAGMRPTGPAR